MPSTSGSVMLQAANHLNDAAQLIYTPDVLMPFLNMALQELEEKLGSYGVGVLKATSITIEVPLGSTELPQMPTDYVEPVQLFERANGSSSDFVEVREKNWIDPNILTTETIVMWSTRGPEIHINPPTTDREVKLNYLKSIGETTDEGDDVDVELSKRYLALLTARNAARDLGNSPTKAAMFADDIREAKDAVIRRLVNKDQNFGARRLPYRGRI